jgi:hypothetical protein
VAMNEKRKQDWSTVYSEKMLNHLQFLATHLISIIGGGFSVDYSNLIPSPQK